MIRGTSGYAIKNGGVLVICKPKTGPDTSGDTATYRKLKREIAALEHHQRRLIQLRNRLYRGYVGWRSCSKQYSREYVNNTLARKAAYYRSIGRQDIVKQLIQRARDIGRYTGYCKRTLANRIRQAGQQIWQKKNQLARIARRAGS